MRDKFEDESLSEASKNAFEHVTTKIQVAAQLPPRWLSPYLAVQTEEEMAALELEPSLGASDRLRALMRSSHILQNHWCPPNWARPCSS